MSVGGTVQCRIQAQAVAAAAALVLALAGPVSALNGFGGGKSLTQGRAVKLDRIVVDSLRPDDTEVRRATVPINPYVTSGVPVIRVTGIEDWDNGCNEPERSAGDTTCGAEAGQGELSSVLTLGVAGAVQSGGASCDDAPLPVGDRPLAALEGVVLEGNQGVSGADGHICLVVRTTLPISAGNLVQSDGVTLTYEIGLRPVDAGTGGGGAGSGNVTFTPAPDSLGEPTHGDEPGRGVDPVPAPAVDSIALPAVKPGSHVRPPVPGDANGSASPVALSHTGASVVQTVVAALALIVSGTLAVLVGRRRRATRRRA